MTKVLSELSALMVCEAIQALKVALDPKETSARLAILVMTFAFRNSNCVHELLFIRTSWSIGSARS